MGVCYSGINSAGLMAAKLSWQYQQAMLLWLCAQYGVSIAHLQP